MARLRGLVRLARATAHEVRGASGTSAIHLELAGTALGEVTDGATRAQITRYLAVLQREQQRLLDAALAFVALAALPEDEAVEFDLVTLVGETGQAIRPLAVERRVDLDVTLPSVPVPCAAVRELVRQDILDVLLPALDAAAAGARLSVRLAAADSGAAITVVRPGADPAVLTLPGGRHE